MDISVNSLGYKLFDKKSSDSGIIIILKQELVVELHESIIRNFEKRKLYSFFKDNISGADLAECNW